MEVYGSVSEVGGGEVGGGKTAMGVSVAVVTVVADVVTGAGGGGRHHEVLFVHRTEFAVLRDRAELALRLAGEVADGLDRVCG